MEEIEIADNCRVCLCSIVGSQSYDLFTNSEESTENIDYLREKLELCCHVKLNNSKNMPTRICTKCSIILNMAYNFGKMCRTSQDYLESLNVEDKPTLYSLTMNIENEKHSEMPEYEKLCEENEIDKCSYTSVEFFEDGMESDDETKLLKEYIDELTAGSNETESVNVKLKTKGRTRRERTYMCSICGNIYNNKATFNYHMNRHLGTKNFECEICHKRFRQSCVLTNHMRTHTGERPFKCKYCNRDFTDKSSKLRHERIHTNERPYICDLCGKSFTYSGILKKHRRTHTGEKPYHCITCLKSFAQPHQLKSHMETLIHKQRESQESQETNINESIII